MLVYEDLSREIRGAAMEVHKELGPGLLESAYEHCLCHELSPRGLHFQRQLSLPVTYKRGRRGQVHVFGLTVEKPRCVGGRKMDQSPAGPATVTARLRVQD